MAEARVILIGKPGCHLCEDAAVILTEVCGPLGVQWAERSIFDDPALADAYWEWIPVVLVDGQKVSHWGVDVERLRAALTS